MIMLDHKLRVVKITNNFESYPECINDTNEFPNLIPYVEDEMAIFIVDSVDDDGWWTAKEFFYMVPITEFLVDLSQL